ncbi:MAG TPA: prolyl oligopeptidase family serine peptidase [Kofleriaceae bacterium]|nr:prolyl oligopeptidase family serine peptidase [Kofleriaceae bacterium]
MGRLNRVLAGCGVGLGLAGLWWLGSMLQPHAARAGGGTATDLDRILDASGLHSSLSVAGGQVAAVHEYGAPRLVLLGVDDPRKVTDVPVHAGWPRDPSLSPNGRHVTYTVGGVPTTEAGPFVRDLAAGSSWALGEGEKGDRREVAWSPGSERLVYTVSRRTDAGWQDEVRVVDLAARREAVLFRQQGIAARAPAWSPDGARIAFLSAADLWVVSRDGADARVVHRMGDAEVAPATWFPDAPVWSPDGTRVAYAATVDGCFRIVAVDVGDGSSSVLTPDECAMRPRWNPDGAVLVYVALGRSSRTLRVRPVTGGPSRPLGFTDGMVYELAFDAAGALIFSGQPSDRPRGVWRVLLNDGSAPQLLYSPQADIDRVSRPQQRTIRSTDGLELPVIVFPGRPCVGRVRGPAMVWVHGGPAEDIAPRWYQEIQFVAALGVTVVAVNYRGSTGNGPEFRALEHDVAGQVDDLVATIDYVRGLPGVDPDQVHMFMVSYGASIGYQTLARRIDAIAGVVDWYGDSQGVARLRDRAGALPPMVWMSGTQESSFAARDALQRGMVRAGARVEQVALPIGHGPYFARDRRATLVAVERFLARLDASCPVPLP